jgi:flagellin
MGISINTNVGALSASAATGAINKSMEISMERLSTGKRINTAADDAAGVAIASRLTAEMRGLNQAIRNSMDAQALIDTAEGAHSEVENLLQRMRELLVQTFNGTNDSTDIAALGLEVTAIAAEIDNIAGTTSWAGVELVDGSFSAVEFQIGARDGETLEVTIADIDTAGLSVEVGTNKDIDFAALVGDEIALVDAALVTLNAQRAQLGAYSNRLDSTVKNLTNAATNIAAGLGRIQDADFAAETTNLAKSQILQQAAMAMLAQANASKQGVLSLLQR